MSPELHRSKTQYPTESHLRSKEAGSITLSVATKLLGGAALSLALLVPSTVMFGIGAANRGPALMTAEIVEKEPLKVETLATSIEEEIIVAKALMSASGTIGFSGHPLGQDLSGNIFGIIPYNFNLDVDYEAKDWKREVRYGFKGLSVPYEYNPNNPYIRDGGSSEFPAIKVKLDLSDMVMIVSDAPEIRKDSYHVTTDGVGGLIADHLSTYMNHKLTKSALGKDLVEGANVMEQIENILAGKMSADINQAVAKTCLPKEGNEFDFEQSAIMRIIKEGAINAILKHFAETHQDDKQPSKEDVAFEVIGLKSPDTAENENQKNDSAYQTALNMIVNENKSSKINIAGFDIDIAYETKPSSIQPSACVIKPLEEAER